MDIVDKLAFWVFLYCFNIVCGAKCYYYNRPSDCHFCEYTYGDSYRYYYYYYYYDMYYYMFRPFPCCPYGSVCTADFTCLSAGGVAVIVIGCLVFIVLLCVLIYFGYYGYLTKLCKRQRKVGTVRITVKPRYTENATENEHNQRHVDIQFLNGSGS